jgi:hypothetical protein
VKLEANLVFSGINQSSGPEDWSVTRVMMNEDGRSITVHVIEATEPEPECCDGQFLFAVYPEMGRVDGTWTSYLSIDWLRRLSE